MLAHDLDGGQRRDEQQVEQFHDGEDDREDEYGKPKERMAVPDQHLHGHYERVLGRPKQVSELDDRQADAERQAHTGTEDGQAEKEPPSAEYHGLVPVISNSGSSSQEEDPQCRLSG